MFKGYLLEAAITDGSLQEMLPEHLRMPADQSYFYPNELSALVTANRLSYSPSPHEKRSAAETT
ncbi:hypothetical protein FCG67_01270 [Rhodococcus oryzae]|uniref:Uncharacterized protein n=1 Tax=Rhodococcus oryzae TaxID=2571143 RepID=A0ABY2RQH6_9NOCA|nr:hypothetical protein [Rhodococcus oryzae]TJZ81309.1 hypothetical protein FCG67_01270 [Rhodococcus oryzae]